MQKGDVLRQLQRGEVPRDLLKGDILRNLQRGEIPRDLQRGQSCTSQESMLY